MKMPLLFVASCLGLSTLVHAQVTYPPPPTTAIQTAQTEAATAKADAAVAKAQADTAAANATLAKAAADAAKASADLACRATPSLQPTEMVGGALGTASTSCRPIDSAPVRISRAGTSTTDSSGNWAITWATATTVAPVVLPIPVNATTQPVVCNVGTRTITGATGRCWLSRTLPATLTLLGNLVSYDLFGGAAPGITVQVLAIPPTQ